MKLLETTRREHARAARQRFEVATLYRAFDTEGLLCCAACGAVVDTINPRWRFTGSGWEHSHGQAGHFRAERKEALCRTSP